MSTMPQCLRQRLGPGSVAENAAISTVIYTAFATDEDNDTLTYSVSGNDASSITIDASTGAVTH